eukprot:1602825-Rhodomonas_salina.3
MRSPGTDLPDWYAAVRYAATRSPVLAQRTKLRRAPCCTGAGVAYAALRCRAYAAMRYPGTDPAYWTQVLHTERQSDSESTKWLCRGRHSHLGIAIVLRVCYAMSGTQKDYAATRIAAFAEQTRY